MPWKTWRKGTKSKSHLGHEEVIQEKVLDATLVTSDADVHSCCFTDTRSTSPLRSSLGEGKGNTGLHLRHLGQPFGWLRCHHVIQNFRCHCKAGSSGFPVWRFPELSIMDLGVSKWMLTTVTSLKYAAGEFLKSHWWTLSTQLRV